MGVPHRVRHPPPADLADLQGERQGEQGVEEHAAEEDREGFLLDTLGTPPGVRTLQPA